MHGPTFPISWHVRASARWQPCRWRKGALAWLLLLVFPPLLLGFAHAKVGDIITNVRLPALAGEPRYFLSETNVSVFIFFSPGKAHSRAALKQIAELRERMRDRPVSWVAIVSDRVPTETVREEIRLTGLNFPVLVDEGDALFGRLGVALYPVVGITDAQRRLRYYLPFHKVNYQALIEAAVRQALGEISAAEFERVCHPSAPSLTRSDRWRSHTRLNLARRLLAIGKTDSALKLIEKCLQQEPDDPEVLLLKGRTLATQGKITEARAVYARLLQVTSQPPAQKVATGEAKSAPPKQSAPTKRRWRGASRLKLARKLFAADKADSALKLVEKCLQQEPDYPEALLLKGHILATQGKIAEARAVYARLLQVTAQSTAPGTPASEAASSSPERPAPTEQRASDEEK